MTLPSTADKAWMAGLFEGEGCITRPRGASTVYLVVKMTDYEPVERFHELAECGNVYYYTDERNPRYSATATFQIGKRSEVKRVLELMWPWLGQRRREKALELGVDIDQALQLHH